MEKPFIEDELVVHILSDKLMKVIGFEEENSHLRVYLVPFPNTDNFGWTHWDPKDFKSTGYKAVKT